MALLEYPFGNISFATLGIDPETYMPTGTTVTQADPTLPQWIQDAQNPASVVLPPSTNPMLSGQEFAKMISGGQAVPSMFAPGVSYSSAQPMGYTAPGASAVPFPSYTGPMNVNSNTQSSTSSVEGTPSDVSEVDTGSDSGLQEFINGLYGLLYDPQTNMPFGTTVNQVDTSFDPSTYDWSTIFDQYSATPDLSNYLTTTDLPTYTPIDTSQFLTQSDLPTYESPDLSNYLTSSDLPTYTQFDPTNYDWSNIFTQPDLSNYLTSADLPTYTTFDPTTYDWSNIFNQPDLSNYLTSSDLSNYLTTKDLPTHTTFDPSTYDWSSIFGQYGNNSIPFDPTNYDWSNIFTQSTPFDPTTYDWSTIFSQPDLSNYALLSDIPTNNAMDTSSFVTQDQLTNLLASLNASSNQFNNNNFSSNTKDIVPLGSYSLLNR